MPGSVIEVSHQIPVMEVVSSLCKGCTLCITHCPAHCIVLSGTFNKSGYKYATYTGSGCTGCGICFYCCPEPGAIIVYRKPKEK
jgi:Pyruvate/2-oxoacid:ferredoxin oxidoreductase delta subunit